MKKLVILLILIFLATNVSALDITISIPRTSYTTGETLQAEVILSEPPTNDLTFSNIQFLKDNQNIQIAMTLEKLSDTYYFIYFNIPNTQSGDYKFKVKDVPYISNNVLMQKSKEKQITINTVNSGFSYLSQQQNSDGSFQNIQTTSLAALALKNNYPIKSNNAIDYLIESQDVTGCYPNNNCNVKDTSFALIALNEFNENIIKTKNWLKDASNNFDLGTWSLILDSTNIECILNGENVTQGTYPITSTEILLGCDEEVTLTLNHLYLGNTYEIFSETTTSKIYTIDNSECYGINYKSECDYESTGYAVWALKEIGENPSTIYLQDNPSDTQTLHHALLYLTTNNQYSFDWLLNNLQTNYWSSQSASLSQTPDNYITSFAAYALKTNSVYQDIKDYLQDKTTNQLNAALILYFHFQEEEILPSISISPGIVNQEQLFSLTLTNNQDPINVDITAPNFTSLPTTLFLEGAQSFIIEIPDNTQDFNIEITYSNITYTIPVLLNTPNPTTSLLPPPTNSITTNFPSVINQTLNSDDKTEDILEFTNNWGFELTNITFTLTGNLNQIIDLETINFNQLQPNETLEQTITINKNKNPELQQYSGYLIITSEQNTLTTIAFLLQFTEDQEPITQIQPEEPNIKETPGEQQAENETKIKPEEEKETSKWLWLVPIAIILIIGILIYFLKGKKIKTKTFGQYIENIKK